MARRPNIAVIPARHDATRFPGKPLALIMGVPLVVRVARQVETSRAVDEVWVATDSPPIAAVVESAGFRSILTESACRTGTDRVARALEARPGPKPGWVLNVQGDEPLIDPSDLGLLMRRAQLHPDAISTLARRPSRDEDLVDPNVVKIALTRDQRALYFSRSMIPFAFDSAAYDPVVHVGVYAYPVDVLARFVAAPASPLESAERLEQLRALEVGIPIYVTMCQANRPSIGVDVPADVARVEAAIRAFEPDRGTT